MTSAPEKPPIGIVEFVGLIALLMALTAMSIDVMLPALADIAAGYAVAGENDRQLVIAAFLIGFALGQPLYGPLSDRFGRRPMLFAGLLVLVAGGLGLAAAGFPEKPPLWALALFLGWSFFCFGLITPNFNALAMEPLGRVAGMAASFIGFYTTAVAAFIGWAVGHAFDGTVRPLTVGFLVLSALALLTVLTTERGVLMQTRDALQPAGR